MDVVVLNEESNMPDREKQFLSGKNHYATYTTWLWTTVGNVLDRHALCKLKTSFVD
jgi:hypothetical protein